MFDEEADRIEPVEANITDVGDKVVNESFGLPVDELCRKTVVHEFQELVLKLLQYLSVEEFFGPSLGAHGLPRALSHVRDCFICKFRLGHQHPAQAAHPLPLTFNCCQLTIYHKSNSLERTFCSRPLHLSVLVFMKVDAILDIMNLRPV